MVRNVNLSLDSDLLARVKKLAAARGLSVDALIVQLLSKEVAEGEAGWIEGFFGNADRLGLRSKDGIALTDVEIYDR